jgi:hypothetical protein
MAAIFMILIGFTGLVWGLCWCNHGLHWQVQVFLLRDFISKLKDLKQKMICGCKSISVILHVQVERVFIHEEIH